MGSIDLHVHTTVSDGTLTPREVVRYAKKKGLKVIAITDHDSVEGNKDAIDEGAAIGLGILPGMEISVEYSCGSMHLLGYCLDIESDFLKEKLEFLQGVRRERNAKILNKLRASGIALEYGDIIRLSSGKQIGRLHFATALTNLGYSATRQEAFNRFLKKGRPAYADRFRFNPEEAIGLVLKSKGIPVLAHPCTLGSRSPKEFEALIMELVQWGLQGIEVYYPDHTDEQVHYYRSVAEKYGILTTGGSDYHGDNKPGVDIGVYNGDDQLSISLIDAMREFRGNS